MAGRLLKRVLRGHRPIDRRGGPAGEAAALITEETTGGGKEERRERREGRRERREEGATNRHLLTLPSSLFTLHVACHT
jgi:hypothetical protein